MIRLSLAELAELTGGRLAGAAEADAAITGAVVIDSRQVAPGDLFVALPGTHADGHDHAAAAVRAGAVAVLAGRPVPAPAVQVDEPQAALGRLARRVLDRLPELTVVAVTGSSGKTSTKDLIAAVLAESGATVAARGSFNNELGVPLTALRATPDTRYLVVEMGARGPGHIAALCRIAPPRIGAVLNVGAAHSGVFGGLEQTARSKGELVQALPAGTDQPAGAAVLNADDPRVFGMASRTKARVLTFGRGRGADVTASGVRLDRAARASFVLHTPAGSAPVQLRVVGEHQVPNALAAAAVGYLVGVPVGRTADALAAAEPASRWRMEVRPSARGVLVVNDAYNANPDSVAAALRALIAITPDGVAGAAGRRWAVLGEMGELADPAGAHLAAGELASRLGVDGVVAVGPGAAGVADGARSAAAAPNRPQVHAVDDLQAAQRLLSGVLRPGDVVLVKASRAAGLDRLAAALLADGQVGRTEPGPTENQHAETGPTGTGPTDTRQAETGPTENRHAAPGPIEPIGQPRTDPTWPERDPTPAADGVGTVSADAGSGVT